jgi:hypothetical protein
VRHAGPGIRVALLAALLVLVLPGWASAAPPSAAAQAATAVPGGFPDQPSDYAISAKQALAAADADPKILDRKAELGSRQGELTASISAEAVRVWEVGYFVGGEKVNLVVVNGETGEVTESWTGSAVDWPMARGHEGQFGHMLNSPWVWGPMAALFLLGLADFRRWRKWVHLDLLVLLSFGVSQAYFNAAEIGTSVPLYYPPLLYLLARMLWIGFRRAGRIGGAGEGLRPSAPVWLLAALCVVLFGGRLAMNIADSGVIDVGYAGVIGADRITDAEPIYGSAAFPEDNRTGDTYGPANYFAYVPFEQVFPWSGSWDDLPAAHAAAIFFDLMTMIGLFALGRVVTRSGRRGADDPDDEAPAARRVRIARRLGTWSPLRPENRLAVTLLFAWLAYPYADFALQANSNDALLSALLVWSLVVFAQPLARGALLATAAMAKFAPLALLPLFAAGRRGIRLRTSEDRRLRIRPMALFTGAFVITAALFLAHPAVDPGLGEFYDRTIKSQVDRVSPFSIWGQTDLEWLHTLVKAFAVGLALLVAFFPRKRSLTQVAALAAAVIIGIELTLEHWFYLYIPWFLPAMLLAMAVSRPARREEAPEPSAAPAQLPFAEPSGQLRV